jgi:glycosyltransferase involved in cell wall biosynthesis
VPTVLQVLPRLDTGGVERGTVEVAEALMAAGWQCVVASEGGRLEREVTRTGAEHVTLPLATKHPLRMRRNADALAALIAERGVDIVHARSRAPAWSALWAARRTGVPFVTTFHGTYSLGWLGLKRRYNAVMTMGDRVIAISEFIKRHVMTEYGTPAARLRVIHRGVDFNRFDAEKVSPERMIQLARKWRLNDDEPIIMLPGRLTRWKGQLLLVEAAALLRQRLGGRPFRCLLVGADQGRAAYRAEIEAAIAAAGLQAYVQVADDCNDMPAAYMLADVVVSASTDPEAFGRIVAESQAMGRPVVAPDHGAAPEIIQHGRTGWLFAALHAGSLAEMLAKALALGAEERAALAGRAVAHVRANFTTAAMTAKTLDVYREVLPGGGNAP